jgi:hypothetical protein
MKKVRILKFLSWTIMVVIVFLFVFSVVSLASAIGTLMSSPNVIGEYSGRNAHCHKRNTASLQARCQGNT